MNLRRKLLFWRQIKNLVVEQMKVKKMMSLTQLTRELLFHLALPSQTLSICGLILLLA